MEVVSSVLIGLTCIYLLGLGANITSVTYFIKKENQGIPSKLMICLNFSDILTLLSNIACNLVYIRVFSDLWYAYIYMQDLLIVIYIMSNSFAITSGCITFVMIVVRTTAICNPFYHIRPKLLTFGLLSMILGFISLVQIKTFWEEMPPKRLTGYKLCGILIVTLSSFNIIMSIAAIIVLKEIQEQ